MWVGGLVTEVCVRATVLDSLDRNFGVVLLLDGICAFDAAAGAQAVAEMEQLGARTVRWEDLP